MFERLTLAGLVRWVLILCLLVMTTAVLSRPAAAEDDLDVIRDRGVVKVAVSMGPPNASKDLASGTWSGPHITLYRRVFEPMGVDVEFVETPWGSMVPGLQSGAVDIALLVVSPARALAVDYSDPIYASPMSVLLLDEIDAEAVTWDDLNREGFRVVLMEGSIYEALARPRLDRAQPVAATDMNDGLLQLETGRADGFVNHYYGLARYAKARGQGRIIIPEPRIQMANAFAIRKGNPALLRYLNTALTVYRLDGTLRDTYANTDTQRFLLE